MTMTDTKKFNWSMIGVIVALIIQAAALVFWGGGLNQRVSALEARTIPLSDGTVARLDERTVAIRESVARIERRLEVESGR